ncbi:hypothetical protein PMAYCL1PPCAC_10621, partial [Pristionchus mayeri]
GQIIDQINLRMQFWQQLCIRCNNSGCDIFTNGASLGRNIPGGFTHPPSSLTIAPTPHDGETQSLNIVGSRSLIEPSLIRK